MINRCVIFLPRKKVDFFGKLLNTIIVQKFPKKKWKQKGRRGETRREGEGEEW